VLNGIPILINAEASVFSVQEIVRQRNSSESRKKTWKDLVRRLIPQISGNVNGRRNYENFRSLLLSNTASPKVLVIGGRMTGSGMEVLLDDSTRIEIVETDLLFGPRTMLICDAHHVPFQDGSFDGLIIQAVLEHVIDPYQCAAEIHRVLRPGGIVYAETPFMQQVHEGRYDFTRFTHLGHRYLFNRFEEIESGAACGPGMALAWSYSYFLLSFSESPQIRNLLHAFARFTSFYLKYFDSYLTKRRGAFDAASAYYFLGKKADTTLSPKELINQYRGLL
jgi:ubiquinone/menaquinone biosynthesis C-methylase UbiE